MERVAALEAGVGWNDKIDKVLWRGTPWFNPVGHPNLRKDLVKSAKGKEWADIQALRSGNASNAFVIEAFCRYKYIVYTEGVSYSGRLPYHQACQSVLIMAPVTWLTTSALLLKPILAGVLMSVLESGSREEESSRVVSASALQQSVVPIVVAWEDANAVYVEPDFSNLEALMAMLRSHPQIGSRIARNQRQSWVDDGYASTAAEVCYWRAFIWGWSQRAQVVKEEWDVDDGERYEVWLLKETSKREAYARGKDVNTEQDY